MSEFKEQYAEFERLGEARVREDLAASRYGERKVELARLWLEMRASARADEVRDTEAARREREIEAANRGADAAERSARSAEVATYWARVSSIIAALALVVAIIALWNGK